MAIVTLRTVCIVIIAIWQKLIDRLCPWLLGSHTPQYLLLNGYCIRRFALFSAVQRVRVALLRLPCVDKFQLLHVNNRYRPSRAKFTSKTLSLPSSRGRTIGPLLLPLPARLSARQHNFLEGR
jgi:hypothetical protein